MIVQCGILFAFLALGELIVLLTGINIPSSIIGMLGLTFSLKAGIIKLRHVEKAADFFVHNLGFFFVPAGIGLMRCLDLVTAQWLPILAASVVSTVVIIAVTGHVHQIALRMMSKKSHNAAIGQQAE